MKKVIMVAILFLAGCQVVVDPPDCAYDWECGDGVCSAGVCIQEQAYPPGHVILQCGCWYYTQGETRYNSLCENWYDVTFACSQWCPGGGFAWGRMCE